jgi:hypothetical protein
LAMRREIATDRSIIDTSVKFIKSGSRSSFPKVFDVCCPPIRAPKKTMMPNNPGIAALRIIFAPYATEKAGPVPLPPIVNAKNIAMRKGISMILNMVLVFLQNYKKDERMGYRISFSEQLHCIC